MDITPYLGTSFDCDCGKRHTIPTDYYRYGTDSLQELVKVAERIHSGGSCLIIADSRTWSAGGETVYNLFELSGRSVARFILPDHGTESPVADDTTKDYILANAPEADLYISVGSGVINDLVKWVSFLRKKVYLTVPTAASMNGYGSANVAASVDGLKVLFHAEACRALFAHPEIIYSAPDEMTSSGLGDVLAKSVSSADWKLNQFLFGDYYCQFSVDLLKDLEPVYLDNPEGIYAKDPEALKALFEALFYSSIAMTITGTSSPASGGEHLISHTLDMTAYRDGNHHDLHGRQVGVASIFCAALYQEVMAIERPSFTTVAEDIDRGFWTTLSEVVEKEYSKKLTRINEAEKLLSQPGNWQQLRELLKPGLIAPVRLKNCLKRAGGAHRFSDIRTNDMPLSKEQFLATVLSANQMRQRFTILDLAMMVGVLPGRLEDIVDRWVTT